MKYDLQENRFIQVLSSRNISMVHNPSKGGVAYHVAVMNPCSSVVAIFFVCSMCLCNECGMI